MPHEPDVYSRLASSKVSEVTAQQLESSTENSYVAKKNVEFWKGPITIHATMKASRTYPYALPIPEKSAVYTAAGTTVDVQPTGTEVWDIFSISILNTSGGDETVTVTIYDGSTASVLGNGVITAVNNANTPVKLEYRFNITNSAYIRISCSASVTGNVAYNVVGL